MERGWNGSRGRPAAAKPEVVKKGGRRWPYGLAAVLAAAVAVGIAVVLLREEPEAVETAPERSKAIAEVKPAAAAPAVEEKPDPLKETYRDERGILRYRIGNGRAKDPTRPVRKINPFRDKDGNKRLPSIAIFKSRPENELALLVGVSPGTTLFGTRRYDERFEKEFLKCLENKIEVLPTDSPKDAAIKEAVAAAKLEVKARMDAGEKLADILGEARRELVRLSQYKIELKRQVAKIVKEHGEFSEGDVGDCVDAANEMLKSKGISPISKSMFIRGNIRVQSAAERASQEKRNTTERNDSK